jgi:thiol-disulfide isomerase/thioredoxin
MQKIILSAFLLAFVSLGVAQADLDTTKPVELKFTALDGREVDLAKLRGKVVLIDFWATWCPPCRHISPDIVGLYKKYHSQGLEIIGVSVDSDHKGLADVIKEEGLVWPQYCDFKGTDNAIAAQFGIEEFPTLLLLNKKGIIVNKNLVDLWLNADGRYELPETSKATLAKVDAAIEKELKAP